MNETQPSRSQQQVVRPLARADAIIKDILDNHLPRIIEGLKAGYVDENQILVVYDHAVRARVLKEHDTGEQPCIGSDANAVLRKWANDQAQRPPTDDARTR